MVEHEFGTFVKSKAGHDKDEYFMLLEVDSKYGYFVDGKVRKLENPKKKNLKHIQIIPYKISDVLSKYVNRNQVTNEEIKRAIKILKLEKYPDKRDTN